MIIFYTTFLFALFFTGCGSASEPPSMPIIHNDPLEKEQWYLDSLKVHDVNVTGKGVVIALVDDGVDVNHPDLKDNILDGNYNYLSSEHNFSDALHGTACAGIMISVQKNDIGIRGIAPDAKLLAYNVLNQNDFSKKYRYQRYRRFRLYEKWRRLVGKS